MKTSRIVLTVALAVSSFAGSSFAEENGQTLLAAAKTTKKAEPSLETQLQGLSLNPASEQRKSEPLYVIQKPQSGTENVWSFQGGMGKTLDSNIFIDSYENFASLTYHINDRFFAKAFGSRVYNEMTESGSRAWEQDGIFPNTSFITSRWDLNLGFNLVYGKARITRDGVFYFNQYFSAGAGRLDQYNGQEESTDTAFNAEAGFSLWFGQYFTMNLGVKNYNYMEHRILDQKRINHLVGFAAMGFRLGGAG